jgi:hypothetical protein
MPRDVLAAFVLVMALPACAVTGAGREPTTGARVLSLEQGSVDALRDALAQLVAAKDQYRRVNETYRLLVSAIVGNDAPGDERSCQGGVPVRDWPVETENRSSAVRNRGLRLLEQELFAARCRSR